MSNIKEAVKEKGLYLYCIRPSGYPYIELGKTIDGKNSDFIMSVGELEAVVSEVNLDEFNSEEIQKKAQEDLNWIKEKAQIHEYVIEQAMRYGEGTISVIPMKFGNIFKSKESLEMSLLENYHRIKEGLKEVQGKQEWALKVYLKRDDFTKWIEQKNEDIKSRKKEIENLSQGMAFFAQKKLNDIIDKIACEELGKAIQDIFDGISDFAETAIKAKNLEKELTGKKEEMVLNAYFLVKEDMAKKSQQYAEDLLKKYGSRGFQIACIGPLPHYHFIQG